jgi:hypothetical protein
MTNKLNMPPNCVLVPPQHGTVVGFIGAETFRKAADHRVTTPTRPEDDATNGHEGDEVTNFIKSDQPM